MTDKLMNMDQCGYLTFNLPLFILGVKGVTGRMAQPLVKTLWIGLLIHLSEFSVPFSSWSSVKLDLLLDTSLCYNYNCSSKGYWRALHCGYTAVLRALSLRETIWYPVGSASVRVSAPCQTSDVFKMLLFLTATLGRSVYIGILTVILQGKGISSSSLPYSRNAPAWFKLSSESVVEQIIKYARKGLTPSQIGVLLRDSHGVTQTKVVTGNKILRILKSNGLAPEIPEDLYFLIKKAVSVRKHLERNRKDKDSKFRLILIDSRIHRLARYYRTVGVLPPNWKYESATASALVN